MSNPEYDPIRWKAGVLIAAFAFAFSLVVGRVFWVQVMEGARYRDLARKQYESKVALRAERGRFFDRHMREIASTVSTTSFAVDPKLIEHPDLVAQLLATVVGDRADEYLQKIRQASGRFVWLARGVNTVMYPILDTITDRGLIRVREPKRSFSYGPGAAQIIGTVDTDNNGLTGLELQFDSLLKGEGGFVVMQRDGRGQLRAGVNPERKSARNGNSLQLTIDIELQRVAEQELRRGIDECGAASGTVVAIEPATGEILAMASVPTFNPNRLDQASPDAVRIRAITDQYEPGSTMKTITAAALLEERKIAPNDRVDGFGGVLQMQGHIIRDDHPLNATTFQIAFEQSSNIVFGTLSKRIDDRRFYKYVRDFGFGIPLGIDLPGEVRGRLKRPNEFDAYSKFFMSYGYELSATALQMLNAYAAIANNGTMMQPHLVKGFLAPNGDMQEEVKPQVIRRVVSRETAEIVRDMLVSVVERGTGQNARIAGVRIAGKTGTAQQVQNGIYSKEAYTASFVGFYPADNPRVAMIVMLDKPTVSIYGGSTAAPIFKKIVQKTMTMLQLEASVQTMIAASAAADTVVVPDVRGLRTPTADTVLRRLGLQLLDTPDTGLIMRQTPFPGMRTARGTEVGVELTAQNSHIRPDVTGFTLRRAVTVLHSSGYEVRVSGSGRVIRQEWTGPVCTLVAQ
ncbi:MAG: hypothetical protein HYX66_09825 [Ignavibacteria bacterium]|nr:hypothetical protein [Ignavibacteria bacterium]